MDKKDIMIEGLLNRIKTLEFENVVMFAELTESQMKLKEREKEEE
jgi:hypothetical protein